MKPIRSFALAALALTLMAACGDDDKPIVGSDTTAAPPVVSAAPSLSIVAPPVGAAIKGNVVALDMASTGLEIVKADGDTSGRSGHYHVFIDRDPVAPGSVIPVEAGVVHSTDDPIMISGLGIGAHRVAVVLGDGTHARMGTAVAETTVNVEGPSVDVSAPATSPAGQPVVLTAKVEGLNLVKADGDTSGATGHLHVFVDREPTPAGQPIPVEAGIIHTTETTISVPDLAPGAHTFSVVAGDGTHSPLNPPVRDKVTVTVK